MKKISCLFCGEDLGTLYAEINIDAIAPCPRCGAMITFFTTDLSGISALLAKAVFDTAVSAEQRDLAIRIQPDVDTLIEDGNVTGMVNLAVAWDPSEMLTTTQTARILGLTRERVSHLCQSNAFPGAIRLEPSRPKLYSRGPWRVPRQDVENRMRRNK